MYIEPLVTISLKEYQELKKIEKESKNSDLANAYKEAILNILKFRRLRGSPSDPAWIEKVLSESGISVHDDMIRDEIKIFCVIGKD